MKEIVYKGKHSDLCRDIAGSDVESALSQIYAYMRSEENVDSYSIELLTVIRELLDDSASETINRLKVRMHGNGDKVMINLAQFAHAFLMGNFRKEAGILAEKCADAMSSLRRSMQDYLEDHGRSQATEMAGMRIREAMRILSMVYVEMGDGARRDLCDSINLEMTRVFLSHKGNMMSEDMMKAAKCEQRRGNIDERDRICHEIIEKYGSVIESIEKSMDFQRELYETLDGVRYAYETLNAEHAYDHKLRAIQRILGVS